MKAWINGKFVGAEGAKVPICDRGLLYGDGLFETMRSYSGRIFKQAEHLARLFNSSKVVGIDIPYSAKELMKVIDNGLYSNKLKDAYIRITVTRGEGAFNMTGGKASRPNVFITMKEFKGYPGRFYSRGISAKVSAFLQDENSPLSRIKSLNFLNHILARRDAQVNGFDEAILLNMKKRVAEAAASNIFLVKGGRISTPSLDSGILPGITRDVIIGISGKASISAAERPIRRDELMRADEIFLTNSLAEVLPVVKIGRARIGSGRPGEVTKLLHAFYRQMV